MSIETETALQGLADDALPYVSVLVPVRNEAGYIGQCLWALATQDYPHDRFEVLIIDGESTDATVAEARAVTDRHPDIAWAFWPNPKRTTASGLNLGIWEVSSESTVVIRVDGHTYVDPTFLSASVRALHASGADAVGGPIRTTAYLPGWTEYPPRVLRAYRIRNAIALAMASRFGIGDAAFRLTPGAASQEVDSVPFAAYRRDVFERVGGFAEDIDRGEDDEFNYRLRAAGGRIVLDPAIGAEYYARETLAGLWRQYWRYGIAKANVLSRHPGRLRPRHLVPSALVLTLGLGVALSPLDRRFGRLAALAAGAYAGASALATADIARRDQRDAAPYLPLAFACIHFGAGAGMIAGGLRLLARRWLHRGR